MSLFDAVAALIAVILICMFTVGVWDTIAALSVILIFAIVIASAWVYLNRLSRR